MFSGEIDKLLAAFMIANGPAAMGDEVTMFFTFWGLNALRRPDRPRTLGKSTLQKMFGVMMPRRPGLSHLNFGGAGPALMRQVMRQQHVMSLNELIDAAREQGVRMIACPMTMD